MKSITKNNSFIQKFASSGAKLSLAIITAATILTALLSPVAAASFYNTGSLDVQPVLRDGAQNHSWFVEYLKPGQSFQEQIRISNFSTETKNLNVYVADSTDSENANFFVRDPNQKQDDIKDWTNLPLQKLTLQGGESRIVSVNLQLPKNAGIGLHSGAIVVREKNAGNVYMEKGVRVYLNVVGPAITAGQIQQANLSETASELSLQTKTINLGTTDFKINYGLKLKPIFGESINSENQIEKVKPQTSATSTVSMAKPTFGIYQIYATSSDSTNSNTLESPMGIIVFVPFWALFFTLSIALAFAKPNFKKINSGLKKMQLQIGNIPKIINNLQFQKSAVYFGIFAVIATVTIYNSGFDSTLIKSQILKPKAGDSYELTVKWGNFRDLILPTNYKQSWQGEVSVSDAKISIKELLDFETSDNTEITNDNQTLKFNLQTGPDNDGIILKITPTGDATPKITYLNSKTNEKITFDITQYLNSSDIFPNGLFATYIKTDLLPENAAPNISSDLSNQLSASSEASSTADASANIPELKNLFIEDLPATPQALSDFVLNSDYVEKIATNNQTSNIDTNPILIQALSATPDVLREIVATPDLNYIFVPSDIINFPAQEFSFNQSSVSGEDLGTMIFVHNKDVPWNTYVGTTNFTSLSNQKTLPANALTVIPGNASVLTPDDATTGGRIETGNAKTFVGTSDKTILVNVQPEGTKDKLFSLNPHLEIRIPAGTLPGRYQGTLTITSL